MTKSGLEMLLEELFSYPQLAAKDRAWLQSVFPGIHPTQDVDAHLRFQVELEAGALYLMHRYAALTEASRDKLESSFWKLDEAQARQGRAPAIEARRATMRTSNPEYGKAHEELQSLERLSKMLRDFYTFVTSRSTKLEHLSNNARVILRGDMRQPG